MRVLIVSQYFWPENFPINDLAKGLRQRGHDVTVLTGMPNYPGGRFYPGYRAFPIRRDHYEGVTIVRVPMVPKGRGNAARMLMYYSSLAITAGLVTPIFFRKRVDLVFVYQPSPITVGLPALILKGLDHLPVWIWVQDLWPETLVGAGMVRSPFLLKLTDCLARFIYSKCERVLVQSQAFVPRMVKKGVRRERICFFPNSAQELYKPTIAEPGAPEQSLMPRGFRVLFAGNIGRAQDIPTILSAAEKLKEEKDIHWVILGDGPVRPWAEKRVSMHGLEKTVHLLGRYPEEAMPRFFSLADVLLVTLKKDPVFAVTIPSKIQSYLACGRPIVAALDGEGARVIEESGGGVTVPSGDADALARAVLKMYGMPKYELERMGLLSREYSARHFEINTLLDKLDCWMREEVSR